MTLAELKTELAKSGYPVAYGSFETFPAPPFITYEVVMSNNMNADNKVYLPVDHIQIDLWTKRKDQTAQAAVEKWIPVPWQKTEMFSNDEQIYQTTYEIEV